MWRNVAARHFVARVTSLLQPNSIWKTANLAVFRSHFTVSSSGSIFASSTHLSWVQAILEPSADPDFAGQLSWEHRRYLVGIYVLHKPHLCLGMFLRPLHLYRVTNQNAQLEEAK